MEDATTMLGKEWKTIEGEPVADLASTFAVLVESGPRREVHIGSDSQQDGKSTQFVTVLVALQPGKGGRAFYCKERSPRIKSLRERLMREVWLSVSLGLELSPRLDESCAVTVHIDANPNLKFKSSSYVKELTSMVVGQGFSALLKPESWAASHAADHVVKVKVLGL
jgi:predicted RNase H-related nuclease YkuK (DUF458 family)